MAGRRGPGRSCGRVDPFKGWVLGHPFPDVALHQLALDRPLLRRLGILKPFGERVDEHEPGYVFG